MTAFLAASFAFGRVASIFGGLERILGAMGPSPSRWLEAWDGELPGALRDFRYRWISASDLGAFLRAVRSARREGSLRQLLARHDVSGAPDLVPALTGFFADLRKLARHDGAGPGRPPSRGLLFLLPEPERGSTCKRAHLFLRWMVRRDTVDLGLWPEIETRRLLLPMDTHLFRIARYLGLTRRATPGLPAVREATAALRRLDPEDPVRYDFALARMGILNLCVKEIRRSQCETCIVRPLCRVTPLRGAP